MPPPPNKQTKKNKNGNYKALGEVFMLAISTFYQKQTASFKWEQQIYFPLDVLFLNNQ